MIEIIMTENSKNRNSCIRIYKKGPGRLKEIGRLNKAVGHAESRARRAEREEPYTG
jgi:hypothetical protein